MRESIQIAIRCQSKDLILEDKELHLKSRELRLNSKEIQLNKFEKVVEYMEDAQYNLELMDSFLGLPDRIVKGSHAIRKMFVKYGREFPEQFLVRNTGFFRDPTGEFALGRTWKLSEEKLVKAVNEEIATIIAIKNPKPTSPEYSISTPILALLVLLIILYGPELFWSDLVNAPETLVKFMEDDALALPSAGKHASSGAGRPSFLLSIGCLSQVIFSTGFWLFMLRYVSLAFVLVGLVVILMGLCYTAMRALKPAADGDVIGEEENSERTSSSSSETSWFSYFSRACVKYISPLIIFGVCFLVYVSIAYLQKRSPETGAEVRGAYSPDVPVTSNPDF